MLSVTEKQYALLRYIKDYMHLKPVAPSFEEMMDHMGMKSKSGVHRLLAGLEERGHIYRMPNRARAIRLLEEK